MSAKIQTIEKEVKNTFDLIIIGGGAAGMMAAVSAARARPAQHICIIEKNSSLGEKLKISGGGRCNITNDESDIRTFLSVYGENDKYLYSAFSEFNKNHTFSFFESLGLPLIVEARKRAFPQTQKAFDVYQALYKEIQKFGVVIMTNTKVKKIVSNGKSISHAVVEKGKEKIDFFAKDFILSTGGLSHPETGSTGDGFRWLTDLGHTVVKPTPSIVPLRVEESYIHALSGTSLSFMRITFFVDGKKAFMKKGKVLFTHFGLSGPLILNSSKEVADLLPTGLVTATIDMYPDTDIGALDKSIRNTFDQNKNKSFKNVIKEIVPEGMHQVLLQMLSNVIDGDKKVHSITKDERRVIVDLLKVFPMTISGLMGFDRAVIADGGVPLSEIETKTMRSKKIDNLFIIGDLLHVNRPSGGYSLQLCWTTGFVAGEHAGK
jgi:predicted Rossmann fold flavoprotein